MKKIIKYTLYTILILVSIFFIIAYFAPGHTDYSKSIKIHAPKTKVWTYISTLDSIDQWSPWNAKDPDMKKTFTGTSGAPKSMMCWESDDDGVGTGCQEITSIEQQREVNTKIQFIKPFTSTATSSISIHSISDTQTLVTWSFHSEAPYPWRIMNLFMDMKEMLDPDFTMGLSLLKSFSERP